MDTFTIVQPTQRLLPHDLALLLAPVRVEKPSHPDAFAGRAEGVVLDDHGHIRAFIVRLAHESAALRGRTLIPASDVTVTPGPVLCLPWTEERLLTHPQLDTHPLPDEAPAESQKVLAASSGQTPPQTGVHNGAEAAKEGLEGAGMGAALGAFAGLALGGPILAGSLAVFFAIGGVLCGVIAGAGRPEPEANDTASPEHEARASTRAWLRALEDHLSDPAFEAGGFVTTSRVFAPTSAASTTPPVAPVGARRSA